MHEPNLKRLHQTDPTARAFRVLTHASFSPLPLAFRLEMDDARGAILHAAWLGDDAAQVPAMDGSAGSEAALNALPRQSSARRISGADARELWSLLHGAIPRGDVLDLALDGNWIVIEAIENGERTVRFVRLGWPPGPTGRLVCALAAKSLIPERALEQALRENPCAESAPT